MWTVWGLGISVYSAGTALDDASADNSKLQIDSALIFVIAFPFSRPQKREFIAKMARRWHPLQSRYLFAPARGRGVNFSSWSVALMAAVIATGQSARPIPPRLSSKLSDSAERATIYPNIARRMPLWCFRDAERSKLLSSLEIMAQTGRKADSGSAVKGFLLDAI
jgi:hypothetical protein